MDHLCELPNDAARRKALNVLPPTLHATYERILQRINKSNKEVQQLVQRSLRWLVCSKVQLSSLALCEAISIENGDTDLARNSITDEDEILRWCSSLVRRSALGDSLELAHFTVKEFLMTSIDPRDREFGIYHFSPEIDDAELAEKCLTYLSFQSYTSKERIGKMSPSQSGNDYTFRQYAVLYWPEHARKNLSKPIVSSLTQELLHPSKRPAFISWAQELRLIVNGELSKDAENTDLTTASPLHFASMLSLPECCEWLLQKGCSINQTSAFGSPLECALLGDAALAGRDLYTLPKNLPAAELGESRLATVKLLIGEGADVHRHSLGQPSPMSIALRMADKFSCIELLRNGALIDSDAIIQLSRNHRSDLASEIWKEIDTNKLRPKDRANLLDAALRSAKFSEYDSSKLLAHRSQDMLEPYLTAAKYGQFGVIEQILQDNEFYIHVTRDQDQRSALHIAASNDHLDIVKLLIEQGADCTLADSQGRTPLHSSVEKFGRCRCFEFLLSLEVDVDSGDVDGLTVWHLALLGGNIRALSLLRGFTERGQPQVHLKANDGRTFLHCAAQSSSKDALIFLMDLYNQDVVHDTTSEGFTALHYAVKGNSLDAVQYLIDHKFDTNAKTNDGSNTLHCALDYDTKAGFEIVELLLQKGVDPCEVRKDGMTPIHLLLSCVSLSDYKYKPRLSKEFETILRTLTKCATSLDITDGAGLSPLHRVCQLPTDTHLAEWRPIALQVLVQNGADPMLQDKMGRTALTYLVEALKTIIIEDMNKSYSFSTMIEKLLCSSSDEQFVSKMSADPQILCLALISKNEDLAYDVLEYSPPVDATVHEIFRLNSLEVACFYGCSRQLLDQLLERSKFDRGAGSKSALLCFACQVGRSNGSDLVVTHLLDLGFDPNVCTVEGKSALMFAAEAGDLAVVEILVNHCADTSATDENGWSVIHYALQSGSEELWHFLFCAIEDWNAVITVDLANLRSRDATALHLAASLDSCALDFLLKNELVSDINHVTHLQETALCIAVLSGISRNVDLLLEANADASIFSTGHWAPLHIAAYHGNMAIVKIFASRGENLNLHNGSGFTSELAARRAGHLDVANFLKDRTSAGNGNHPFSKIAFASLNGPYL